MSEDTALSEAKQTLLSALDSITEVEEEMDAEVRHVAVVYSVYKSQDDGTIHEQGGWNHTSDPDWLIGATRTERYTEAGSGVSILRRLSSAV